MKILINTTTDEVMLGGSFEFVKQTDRTQVLEDGREVCNIFYVRPEFVQIVEVDSIPDDLAPGKYLHQEGEFVLNPCFATVK